MSDVTKVKIVGTPPRTGGLTVPGWGLVTNICAGKPGEGLIAVWKGPADTIDAARTQIYALGLRITSFSPEPGEGSGVGTIRINYAGTKTPPPGLIGDDGFSAGNDGPDDQPAEDPTSLTPDLCELTPSNAATALISHPAFDAVRPACSSVDEYLTRGDISGAVAACKALTTGSDVALSYLGLRLAGVTSYDVLGKTYTITRELGSNATNAQIATLTAQEGKVVAWSEVIGHEHLPEPQYTDQDGTKQSYEWRCLGARISKQVGETVKVTVTYQGAWKWAGLLYKGGTWYPQAPAS